MAALESDNSMMCYVKNSKTKQWSNQTSLMIIYDFKVHLYIWELYKRAILSLNIFNWEHCVSVFMSVVKHKQIL